MKLYSIVRIKKIHKEFPSEDAGFNKRLPKVGDEATIIEVYTNPPGYELECIDDNGVTQWQIAFSSEEIELELTVKKRMKKASIKTRSLKDFLSLFDEEAPLVNLSFGDTWHPSSGYIDESILNGKNKVKDLLEFNYDFKGLVGFEAKINNINVVYKNDTFEIKGPEAEIRNINDKVIELNAYTPEKYTFSSIKTYE